MGFRGLPSAPPITTWTLEGVSADNTALSRSRPGEAGRSHFVVAFVVAISATLTNGLLVTLSDGGTTIGRFHLRDRREIAFPIPIKITEGATFEISIPAGGIGNLTSIFVVGHTA